MAERQPSSSPMSGHFSDEAALVERACTDAGAFAALYDRYVLPVHRYMTSRQGDLQLAQALVGQVFLALRDALPQYLPGDSFPAFLFSIARSQLTGYLRGGGRLAPVERTQMDGMPGQQLDHLRGLIRGLSEGEQELLRLRYAAGLGYGDLAALISVAPEAVKTQLDRILNRLLSQSAGKLDDPHDARRFENQVRAAVRGAEAAPAFVARLRNQLLESAMPAVEVEAQQVRPALAGPAAPASRPAGLPGPTWPLLLLALALFLLLMAVLAIGPQRIWAEALALVGVPSRSGTGGQGSVQLTPQPVMSPAAPLEPDLAATAEPAGIRFTVDEVTELADGYLLKGSLSWQGTEFYTLGFDPYRLQLRDADGKPISIEPAEPDARAIDPDGQRMPWAVRAAGKDYPGPLTLELPALEGYLQVNDAVFDLDLGSAPRLGQAWSIDRMLETGGRQVHILSARLNQTADGAYWLDFSAQVDSQQVTGLVLRDPGSPPAQSGGQGGSDGQGLLTESLRYDSLPQGMRRIEITGIWALVGGRWMAPVVLPGR